MSLEFEDLTAVAKKTSLFWDITPRSPFKINQSIGGTCRLQLQGQRIIQTRNQHKAGSKEERQLIFNGLHGVVSLKI
jgi:hypothetical protein